MLQRSKKLACRVFAFILCLTVPLLPPVAFSGCGEPENQSLTVFCYNQDTLKLATSAIGRFEYSHPDLKVEFVEIPRFDTYIPQTDSEEKRDARAKALAKYKEELPAIYDQVRSELIAGKGPDLIIFGTDEISGERFFPDVYKSMASGVFTDLAPLIAADENYEPEHLNQTVIAAGKLGERQYVMPLFYHFETLTASSQTLAAEGFDAAKRNTCTDFYSEAARYAAAKGARARKVFATPGEGMHFPELLHTNPIDYANQTAKLDTPSFQQLQEAYRELYENDLRTPTAAGTSAIERLGEQGDSLFVKGETLKLDMIECARLLAAGSDPVFFPMRDDEGKIAAQVTVAAGINDASRNKQNAYNFLKELLGRSVQNDDSLQPDFPVRDSLYSAYDKIYWMQIAIADNIQSKYGELPDEFYEEVKSWMDEIGPVSFETDLPEKLYSYFEPYYKGSKPYEDCLKDAEAKLRIYVAE